MPRPWEVLESVDTADGRYELRRRGERDFLLTVDDRVVMTTQGRRSEIALGELACAHLARRSGARVLVAGLGMGYTLRAALDVLPADASVVVAELNPVVVDWCRGPLGALTDDALADPRVAVEVDDVRAVMERATGRRRERFAAIVLDLFEGPPEHGLDVDPVFSDAGLSTARAALAPDGVLAVWSEDPGPRFERALGRAGFTFERRRPGKGGRRHVVYLATRR